MTDTNPFGMGAIRRQVAAPEELKAGALVVGAVVPAEELQLHDQMYREAARDFPGSGEILFEDGNPDADNEGDWYSVKRAYGYWKSPVIMTEAQRWQRLMDWPRLPTYEEASQWQASADAEALNALSDRAMVFRQRFAECRRLAEVGGIAFWRPKMSLPPDRAGLVSIADVVTWLLDVAPEPLEAWRKELTTKG
jgi:hypothetical protein